MENKHWGWLLLALSLIGLGVAIAMVVKMPATLTTVVAIAFSGMVSGSGYMAPTTIPTTIAGGCVNGPWLPGTHIGGVAITIA
jgi:hypothetical protein